MTKTASRTKIMSNPRERMLWDLTYIDSPALVEIDSDSNGSRDFRRVGGDIPGAVV